MRLIYKNILVKKKNKKSFVYIKYMYSRLKNLIKYYQYKPKEKIIINKFFENFLVKNFNKKNISRVFKFKKTSLSLINLLHLYLMKFKNPLFIHNLQNALKKNKRKKKIIKQTSFNRLHFPFYFIKNLFSFNLNKFYKLKDSNKHILSNNLDNLKLDNAKTILLKKKLLITNNLMKVNLLDQNFNISEKNFVLIFSFIKKLKKLKKIINLLSI
jgi:hypothetical protein